MLKIRPLRVRGRGRVEFNFILYPPLEALTIQMTGHVHVGIYHGEKGYEKIAFGRSRRPLLSPVGALPCLRKPLSSSAASPTLSGS